MAQTLRLPLAFAGKAILALACAASLAACGHNAANDPTVASADVSAGGGTGGTAPKLQPGASGAPAETAEPAAANPDPAEGPVNLPPIPAAPATPVDPAAMVVHSVAETLSGNPAPGLMGAPGHLDLVRAKVTWTPIKGASSYRIYQLATHDGQADGDKGQLIYKLPGWMPVVIVGGGMGFTNLAVGQEYVYTVEAIDRAGNIIARGQDNCAPLAPLAIPYLKDPGQNAMHVGQTPYFSWTPSNGADGYYIEAFATVRGTLPAVPMWRCFRSNPDSMTAQYGQQIDVMEGSKPLQWALPLNIGARYAWTVCAIRTDTHTMNTCKAIARATAPINYFLP